MENIIYTKESGDVMKRLVLYSDEYHRLLCKLWDVDNNIHILTIKNPYSLIDIPWSRFGSYYLKYIDTFEYNYERINAEKEDIESIDSSYKKWVESIAGKIVYHQYAQKYDYDYFDLRVLSNEKRELFIDQNNIIYKIKTPFHIDFQDTPRSKQMAIVFPIKMDDDYIDNKIFYIPKDRTEEFKNALTKFYEVKK